MRYMMIVKGDPEGGADFTPSSDIVAQMRTYNAELVKAGVMLAGEGLYPSSEGVRLKFSGGRSTVVDGPFTESKELIAGFWIIEVKSKEEAVEWASRMPGQEGSEVELRRVYEV
ncbi:YciI family protein [Nonomuraea sp. NPDC050556]|uniref:YciI family protein n=1 Tax=Nonomuraea sp. NPDC050556 TaxID=3364369 RepID=UPI0037B363E1